MTPEEAARTLRRMARDPNGYYSRRNNEALQAGADALDRLADLDDTPHHVIEFRTDGWTLKHPLSCRPHLFDCPVNEACQGFDGPPAAVGRYVVDLDGDGELRIGEEVRADG